MPTIGALNDPAAWFSVDNTEQWGLAAAADVGHDASCSNLAFGVRVVVALVEA